MVLKKETRIQEAPQPLIRIVPCTLERCWVRVASILSIASACLPGQSGRRPQSAVAVSDECQETAAELSRCSELRILLYHSHVWQISFSCFTMFDL